jgi:hypothetical protein
LTNYQDKAFSLLCIKRENKGQFTKLISSFSINGKHKYMEKELVIMKKLLKFKLLSVVLFAATFFCMYLVAFLPGPTVMLILLPWAISLKIVLYLLQKIFGKDYKKLWERWNRAPSTREDALLLILFSVLSILVIYVSLILAKV